jgi:hypothetical protein
VVFLGKKPALNYFMLRLLRRSEGSRETTHNVLRRTKNERSPVGKIVIITELAGVAGCKREVIAVLEKCLFFVRFLDT